MKSFSKKAIGIVLILALMLTPMIPAFSAAATATYPEATALNLNDNAAVTLEKDGYTYTGGGKTTGNGSYTVSGTYAKRTDSDVTPIVVSGGGDVYLTLNAVSYTMTVCGKAQMGFIEIKGNTTLHLSWVGKNNLVYNGGSTVDPAILIADGSALIMDGAAGTENELIINTKSAYATSCIGTRLGASGAVVKGGSVTINSGKLSMFSGQQAATVGGTQFSYLSAITINGGDIYGQSTGSAAPVIGTGKTAGKTSCKIEINGGRLRARLSVVANQGFCSIIGGCDTSAPASIVINGGDIDVGLAIPEGSTDNCNGLCGIGGSYNNGQGGTIEINGGNINIAFVSNVFNATGIGAPQGGTVDSLTINGGYINVTGKGIGTAIGGARNGTGKMKIYINGGVIDARIVSPTATSSVYPDVIGNTHTGSCVTKVWIAPGASVCAIAPSKSYVTSITAFDTDGNDLVCVAVQAPTFVKSIKVNGGAAVNLTAQHGAETSATQPTYYFYLPKDKDATLEYDSRTQHHSLKINAAAPITGEDDALILTSAAAKDWQSQTTSDTALFTNDEVSCTISKVTTALDGNGKVGMSYINDLSVATDGKVDGKPVKEIGFLVATKANADKKGLLLANVDGKKFLSGVFDTTNNGEYEVTFRGIPKEQKDTPICGRLYVVLEDESVVYGTITETTFAALYNQINDPSQFSYDINEWFK